MSREVADSDDESDVITSAPSRSVSLLQENSHPVQQPPPSTLERDPLTGVNFDDYLSPTQRLSSAVATEEPALARIKDARQDGEVNSSTDRFLDEVAPRSSPVLIPSENAQELLSSSAVIAGMGSLKKRSHFQMSESSSSNGKRNKKKKSQDAPNAYHSEVEAHTDEYGHPAIISADLGQSVAPGYNTSTTEPLDVSLYNATSHIDTATSIVRASYQPYATHSNYFAYSVNYGVPSMSSVGGHQSLNINPSTLGMDFGEINPFGRLSQISNAEDADPDINQTRGIAEIFRNAAANSGRVAATKVEETSVRNGRSESVKNRFVAPAQLSKDTSGNVGQNATARASTPEPTNARRPSESSPAFSPISNRGASAEALIPAEALDVEYTKPAPKRRGRKPKNKLKTDESAVVSDNNMDELQMDEHQLLRQVRANTVDSVSNVSEASVASTGSRKRKHAGKKAITEPEAEAQPKKLPSSDLGLNDKAIIGLSPERYKPRPSKRRGRNVEPEMDIEREVKLIEAAHQKLESQSNVDDVGSVEDVKPKGKRGRKAKVKNMEPERDKVVVDLEEDAERGGTVEEREPAQVLKDDGDQNEDELDAVQKVTNVTINIPPLPKPGDDVDDGSKVSTTIVLEPKKRGRKKKQKLSIAQEEEAKELVGASEELADTKIQGEPVEKLTRPALAEKDPNTTASNGDIINASDEELDPENQTTVKPSPIKHEPNQKPSSPAPPTLPPPTTATTTPSNPNPLFSSPYRIGLSRRRPIPSLLRKVDRSKEPPKAIERKEKLTAAQQREREKEEMERQEAMENGEEYASKDVLRDADGRLVEWDF